MTRYFREGYAVLDIFSVLFDGVMGREPKEEMWRKVRPSTSVHVAQQIYERLLGVRVRTNVTMVGSDSPETSKALRARFVSVFLSNPPGMVQSKTEATDMRSRPDHHHNRPRRPRLRSRSQDRPTKTRCTAVV